MMEQPTFVSGWLEKKSGGKEGKGKKKFMEKWDKRWFILVGSELRYYKSDADHDQRKAPAGSIECTGSELFLKVVQGTSFRFTVKTAERELKLRASSASDYHKWADALTPLMASTGRDASVSVDVGRSASASTVTPPSHTEPAAGGAAAAATVSAPVLCEGWLEKKSGGKEGHEKKSKLLERWGKRYFVLSGSEMHYFKHDEDHAAGKPPLGTTDVSGGTVFLKAVKGQTFRFTVRLAARDLKLRAANNADFQMWTKALGPVTKATEEEQVPSRRSSGDWSQRTEADEEEDDDDLGGGGGGEDSSGGAGGTPDMPAAAGAAVDEVAELGPAQAASRRRPSKGSTARDRGVSFLSSILGPKRKSRDAAAAAAGGSAEANPFGGGGDGGGGGDDGGANPFGGSSVSSPPAAVVSDATDDASGASNPFGNASPPASPAAKQAGGAAAAAAADSLFGTPPHSPLGGGKTPGSEDPSAFSNPFDGSSAAGAGASPAAGGGSAAAEALFSSPVGGEEEQSATSASAASEAEAHAQEMEMLRREMMATGGGGHASSPPPAAPASPAAASTGGAGGDAGSAPFKIIIVGDSGVGKTCLLLRFVEGRYDEVQKATISVDISSARLDLGTSSVGLALWDTAGQERFAPLSAPYFRQADGVVVVFDVGSRRSFERVASHWEREIEMKAGPEISAMLVGAKVDVAAEDRQVSEQEAQELADERGWLYFETSAKTGVHVRDAFYLLACTVMNRLNEGDPRNAINETSVSFVGSGSKKGGCC
jgi:small GTP-binding protein